MSSARLLVVLYCTVATALAYDAPHEARHWYRGAAASPETISSAGTTSWTTHSIAATTCPVADFDGAYGLVLHQQDNLNYYLFIYSFKSTALRIYKRVGGVYTLLSSTPFVIELGQVHRLRAEADGMGNLSFFVDRNLELLAFDATFTAGMIGLRVYNGVVDFDNVLVKEPGGGVLLFDDFEDGNANGWSGGGGWSIVDLGAPGMPIPTIDTSFEGGNIQVYFIDPANWTVYTRPELKGSSPYRAWFYFKMSNLSSAQATHIVVSGASWLTKPCFSYDNENWEVFSTAAGSTFSETFTNDPVWVAHSIPYLTRHKQRLIDDLRGPYVQTSLLATSEGQRPVEMLAITDYSVDTPKYGIWLIARQHAWEAQGSWVADELARWLVSDDPQAASLCRKAVVHVVPIMDIDNVVLGGSGKDQQPIDFNRDWRDNPYWNAVSAAVGTIEQFAASNSYDFFVDSHSYGSHGSPPFLGVQPKSMVSSAYWERFERFRGILCSTAGSGPLAYSGIYKEWGPSYHPLWYQISFWHQFTAHPQLSLSLSLETTSSSAVGYQHFAQGFGCALDLFFDP